MRRRVLWVVAYAAALAVFVAGVVVLVRHQRQDDDATATAPVAELPALAPMPFPATLARPVATAETPVGTEVGLSVTGFSPAGVSSVDLYDGDRLVASTGPTAGSIVTDVAFPALTPGTHPLSAQVTDAEGRVSLTPVVPVTVVPSDQTADLPVPVQALAGETPDDVAARLGVEPDQVVASPPEEPVSPRARIPQGTAIPPAAAVVALVHPDQPPAPPLPRRDDLADVGATAQGCDVVLTGFDGGAYEGGDQGWAQVGGGDGSTTLEDVAPGTHTYVARGADGTISTRAAATVPASCAAAAGWTGDATIVDGVLHLPPGATGRVWLYLTIGRATERVPADPNATLPVSTETPIAALLPPLGGRRLVLEVWRRKGDVSVEKVAAGRLEVPDGHDILEVVGEPTQITVAARLDSGAADAYGTRVELDDRDDVVRFRWQASSPRTEQVMWQLLVGRPPAGPSDPAPAGLLAAGVSEADRGIDARGGHVGEFTIDTADIPGRDPTGLEAVLAGAARRVTTVDPPVPIGMLVVPEAGATSDRTVHDLGTGTFVVPRQPAAPTTIDPAVQVVDLPTYGDDVFVRVIPLDADGAVLPGPASEAVAVRLPVPQGLGGKAVDFTIDSVTYDPGRRTNPDLVHCARVDVPWNATTRGDPARGIPPEGTPPPGGWTFRTQVLAQFYPGDGTYCPPPPPQGCDGILCWFAEKIEALGRALVSFATAIYSAVSTAYNAVIDGIVDLVADTLCGPVVAVAGDDVEGGCTAVLSSVTRAAIGAVLATVGLPPSLPSVAPPAATAAGHVSALAVGLMEQFGVPCRDMRTAAPEDVAALAAAAGVDGDVAAVAADPCAALADAVLAGARRAVADQLNTSMAQSLGLASLAGVEGATMVPEPTGQPAPMSVEVRMHPTESNADATGLVCRAGVRFDSYAFLLAPFDVPLYNPPDPRDHRYPFDVTGASPTASVGTWSGGIGVNDFRPGAGLYINDESPMTATVTVGGGCKAPDRTVTVELRPAEPAPGR